MTETEQNCTLETATNLLQSAVSINTARSLAIAKLLFNVTELNDKAQTSSYCIAKLLDDVRPHIKRIEAENKKNATLFNVFSALGVSRKEVVQSRFLAYMLSPLEDHNQCAIFLNNLLARLGIQEITTEKSKKIRVSTEHSAGNDGRMDIVIQFPKHWIVVIENKIDAGEGVEQLFRYRKWLDKQNGCAEESKFLIFLTPTGHESVTGEIGKYLQMSYIDIANLFLEAVDNVKQEGVRTIIKQYISTCQSIGGVNMGKQDNELQKLLINPVNIRAALEIEQQVAILRKNVAKVFVDIIAKIIQTEKIDPSSEISQKWRAFSIAGTDGTASVEIITFTHKIKPNYRVLGEFIFTHGGKGWCGWCRPSWIDPKLLNEHETYGLSNKMVNNGCSGRAEANWVGSDSLRGGLLGYVLTDVNDIISCINDNQSDEHPLAREIADELWTMFDTYREEIVALDSYKDNIQ